MQWLAGEMVEELNLQSFMGLIKSTQSNKIAWMDKTSSERIEVCSEAIKCFEERLDQLCLYEAEFLNVPADHIKIEAKKTIELINHHLQNFDFSSYYSRGVMLCLLPKTFGLSSFLYMSILGSAYGNSMIIKYKNSEAVIDVLSKIKLGEVISVFSQTDSNTFEMISSHPFLDSMIYMGKKQNFESFQGIDKHQFASFEAINTHVVLKNANLKKAVSGVMDAFTHMNGLSPIKPHRVLVAMAVFEEFKSLFKEHIQGLEFDLPVHYKKAFEKGIVEVKKDTHNPFYEAQGVYITSDLTYCSTFQESEVLGGFLSLSEFKYNHEAAKWINVSSSHRSVTVWAEDLEKAHKLMSKIHAPKILVNKSESQLSWLPVVASGDGGSGAMAGFELPPESLFAQKRIIETA